VLISPLSSIELNHGQCIADVMVHIRDLPEPVFPTPVFAPNPLHGYPDKEHLP
jgi:hypothetical protein